METTVLDMSNEGPILDISVILGNVGPILDISVILGNVWPILDISVILGKVGPILDISVILGQRSHISCLRAHFRVRGIVWAFTSQLSVWEHALSTTNFRHVRRDAQLY